MAVKLQRIAARITTEVAPPRFVSVTRNRNSPFMKKMLLDTIFEEFEKDFAAAADHKCFSSEATTRDSSVICREVC